MQDKTIATAFIYAYKQLLAGQIGGSLSDVEVYPRAGSLAMDTWLQCGTAATFNSMVGVLSNQATITELFSQFNTVGILGFQVAIPSIQILNGLKAAAALLSTKWIAVIAGAGGGSLVLTAGLCWWRQKRWVSRLSARSPCPHRGVTTGALPLQARQTGRRGGQEASRAAADQGPAEEDGEGGGPRAGAAAGLPRSGGTGAAGPVGSAPPQDLPVASVAGSGGGRLISVRLLCAWGPATDGLRSGPGVRRVVRPRVPGSGLRRTRALTVPTGRALHPSAALRPSPATGTVPGIQPRRPALLSLATRQSRTAGREKLRRPLFRPRPCAHFSE